MNSLYNLATRQTAAIRTDVESYSADPSNSARRAQINAAFTTVLKTIEDYEGMAKRELVVAKREKALSRADNFRAEVKQLREAMARADSGGGRAATTAWPATQPAMAPRSRVVDGASAAPQAMASGAAPQYMAGGAAPYPVQDHRPSYPALSQYARPTLPAQYSMPPTQMPYSYGAGPSHDPLAAYRAAQPDAPLGTDSPYSMREGHALREHSFIQNTEAQLDAFIAQGRSVLGNLVEQRGILKGTRKRLLDAANSVGLSRELIVRRFAHTGIDRPHWRARQDYLYRRRRIHPVRFLYVAALTQS